MRYFIFVLLLLVCGTASCVDMYYTFRCHNEMMDSEKNVAMLKIMTNCGIEFAMLCRMMSTIIVIIVLQALYPHRPKFCWALLSVWAVQQMILMGYFLMPEVTARGIHW